MFTEKIREKISLPPRGKSGIFWTGIVLAAISVFLLTATFFPVAKEEIAFRLSSQGKDIAVLTREEAALENSENKKAIYPVDDKFSLIIPKISANARVIDNVDWQKSEEYQEALTRGVAHASGTAHPGEEGNVFIFSHSGSDFFEANRYNAVFYLLNKLERGDEIDIYYQSKKILYRVKEAKVIEADEIKYLEDTPGQKTLTLMTCWPAGTDWKRLVVVAEQTN